MTQNDKAGPKCGAATWRFGPPFNFTRAAFREIERHQTPLAKATPRTSATSFVDNFHSAFVANQGLHQARGTRKIFVAH
jgi:hypothetical protein